VTITGANLTGATSVRFGGTAATSFTINSATQITAITPGHAVGVVDVTVATNNGTGTGVALYSYATATVTTTTTLTSSRNPSERGQAVTFTATVSGGASNGTVNFRDGASVIGTATIAGGRAALTVPSLAVGNHSITASYSGNAGLAASTSTVLFQTVSIAQESVRLRQMQAVATRTVSQNSGIAITGTIDNAISEGFSGGGSLVNPSAGGIRFHFAADPDESSTTPVNAAALNQGPSALGTANSYVSTQSSSRSMARNSDAFAAIDRSTVPAKALPFRPVEKDWLFWADVSGAGIDRWSSSTPAGGSALYGSQVNTLLGLTRRVTPDFLVGAVGGYEIFDYRSDGLNSRLKGDGWTVGSYMGWRFAPGLRFDAAGAYSGIGYDGSAGNTTGNFNGTRWLVSGGLTGTTKASGLEIEPSAKVYALWEHQNAYTDSLGTLQADRNFFTGRASGGAQISYPWLYGATILKPYAGLYADYYFSSNDALDALTGTQPLASVPILDGWSARFTGGLTAHFVSGSSVAVGAELGGIGSSVAIWTFRGRASVPF
jgi:hypothetical protein